jgi:hypothetical protein
MCSAPQVDIARLVAFTPGHSHACVALALGYQRAGRPAASEGVLHCLALAADPSNPVALKNLGVILCQGGRKPASSLTTCAAPTSAIPRTRRPCNGLARVLAAPEMPAARSKDLVRSRHLSIFVIVWPGTGAVRASPAWQMMPSTSLYIYGSKKIMDLQMQRL